MSSASTIGDLKNRFVPDECPVAILDGVSFICDGQLYTVRITKKTSTPWSARWMDLFFGHTTDEDDRMTVPFRQSIQLKYWHEKLSALPSRRALTIPHRNVLVRALHFIVTCSAAFASTLPSICSQPDRIGHYGNTQTYLTELQNLIAAFSREASIDENNNKSRKDQVLGFLLHGYELCLNL